jgi:hypothetical protein
MNSNYLAVVIMVGSPLIQFVAYMILAARQRGRDESKMAEIAEHASAIDGLQVDIVKQRLMIENIATYLEAKNGITFRRF